MSGSVSTSTEKKLIRIDVTSDTVCPWCFVGKKNLDKAIAAHKDRFNFEIKWHPYFLDPSAPKEGVNKLQFYRGKFGARADAMMDRMTEVFKGLGLEYNLSGLTGSTLDSHRLLYLAGQQGLDKQHNLAEELFLGYFTQANYVGDRNFLLECAAKVGVEGAAEFLDDPNSGLKEVNDELKKYSSAVNGVPHYMINGNIPLSGGQPPETFRRAFEAAGK